MEGVEVKNKLFLAVLFAFIAFVSSVFAARRLLDSFFGQGFVIGLFAGVFIVVLLAYLRDWKERYDNR